MSYGKDEHDAVLRVLRSGWPSRGKITEQFEAELSEYLHSNVCVVNNGSSAIMVALLANGVKAGDTVLVPDFTYVATASVPAILGCKIMPMDVDLKTFNMDVDFLVSEKHWLVVTDMAGLPQPNFIPKGAKPNQYYIEDAAEALGAETSGKRIGKEDQPTVFSFQATKQLSTIEGGAIASRDKELIDKCRAIADYGRSEERYVHSVLGMNFRITDVQSALGLIQLHNLDTSLRQRQKLAEIYRRGLSGILQPQAQPSYVTRHAWWTFLALAPSHEKREELLKRLNDAGVDARKPFMPIRQQPCFPQLRDSQTWNSDRIYARGIMLPLYNTMRDEQAEYVIKVAT